MQEMHAAEHLLQVFELRLLPEGLPDLPSRTVSLVCTIYR